MGDESTYCAECAKKKNIMCWLLFVMMALFFCGLFMGQWDSKQTNLEECVTYIITRCPEGTDYIMCYDEKGIETGCIQEKINKIVDETEES